MDSIAAIADPVTENDLGDRFLMRFGFTIVWVGWSSTSRPDPRRCPFTSRLPRSGQHDRRHGALRLDANAPVKEFVLTDLAAYARSGRTTPSALERVGVLASTCSALPRDGGESAVIR